MTFSYFEVKLFGFSSYSAYFPWLICRSNYFSQLEVRISYFFTALKITLKKNAKKSLKNLPYFQTLMGHILKTVSHKAKKFWIFLSYHKVQLICKNGQNPWHLLPGPAWFLQKVALKLQLLKSLEICLFYGSKTLFKVLFWTEKLEIISWK